MRFFFDRNISEHLAKIASAYDRANTVVHQNWDGRFVHDTDDVTLITTVAGDPDTIWVSADMAQRRVQAERAALAQSGLTAVFFRGGIHAMKPRDQALKVICAWDNIVLACRTCREPSVFEISNRTLADKVECVCLTKDLFRK